MDGILSLGFATPAPPTDGAPVDVEPLPIVEEPPTFDRPGWAPAVEATPDGVVRALGDPRPPRAAVPVPERRSEGGRVDERERSAGSEREATDEREGDDGSVRAATAALPTVEARIEAAEELAAVETLDDATAALERVGGLAGARALRSALEDDREALARLEARVADLRGRAALDLPIETLERVA